MKRRQFLASAGALLLSLGIALPVQAAEPTEVGMIMCSGNLSGQWNVKATSDLTFFWGWGTKTKQQANQFKNHANVRFTVNGVAIANPNSYWHAPVNRGPGFWAVNWLYPFGQLGAGNSAKTAIQITLTAPSYDGYSTTPAGPMYAHPLKCRVY
jgi:hypothetical protein